MSAPGLLRVYSTEYMPLSSRASISFAVCTSCGFFPQDWRSWYDLSRPATRFSPKARAAREEGDEVGRGEGREGEEGKGEEGGIEERE